MFTLIKWYSRFSALFLLTYAGWCKNKNASKHIKDMDEKELATNGSVRLDQKDDGTADQRLKNDAVQIEGRARDENSKDHSEQTDVNAQPSFSLQDITIKAGTKQAITLTVAGIAKGYYIKSISVKEASQNGRYRTEQFKVKQLETNPIPTDGLPITLTPDPTLKAGTYQLKIKIGKTGKGSGKTAQWVKCMIHLIKDEIKAENQNESYSTAQTIQKLNTEVIPPNNYPIKDESDRAKKIETHLAQTHTTPDPPSFTLEDITIQAGTQQSIMLAVTGITEGYSIKSISVSQVSKTKSYYYTSKFGITNLKNQSIPSTGLPITLTPASTLKAGMYALKMTIGKTGKGSKTTEQEVKCMIHIIENESKK